MKIDLNKSRTSIQAAPFLIKTHKIATVRSITDSRKLMKRNHLDGAAMGKGLYCATAPDSRMRC